MAKKKAIKKKKIKLPPGFTINQNMPDHSNDPVIKKKVAEANDTLKKFPPPDLIFIEKIKVGLKQAAAGQGISHDKFMKELKKW